MRFTFLGTGTSQGIPVIGSEHPVCLSTDIRDKRLRTAALIETSDKILAIDCGPDFRQQMLVNRVPRLNALLLTHEHADHTAGFDDIRPFFFKQGKVPVYADKRVHKEIERRFHYFFEKKNRYPGVPEIEQFQVNGTPFYIDNLEVVPIAAMHLNLPIWGYRFGKLAYLTDVKFIEKKELDKLKNLEVLVINALRIEPHPAHLSLQEALDLSQHIGAKQTYFTHLSFHMGFHAEIEKKLPQNVHLAFDNLQIEVV